MVRLAGVAARQALALRYDEPLTTWPETLGVLVNPPMSLELLEHLPRYKEQIRLVASILASKVR